MLQYEKIDASKGIDINSLNQIIQKNVLFVIIGILKMLVINLNHMFVINVMILNYELENITILNVKGVDYRGVLWNMTKNDTINRLNNSKLNDKVTL